jgi:hypothetical protein
VRLFYPIPQWKVGFKNILKIALPHFHSTFLSRIHWNNKMVLNCVTLVLYYTVICWKVIKMWEEFWMELEWNWNWNIIGMWGIFVFCIIVLSLLDIFVNYKYFYIIEGEIFKHIFHPSFVGLKIMKPWTDPFYHVPARVEIPHSWSLVWYTLPISRKVLRREGGYCSKAGKYSCLAENTILIAKSSVEKVYFEIATFVWIYPCAFNHPRTMPKPKLSKSCS